MPITSSFRSVFSVCDASTAALSEALCAVMAIAGSRSLFHNNVNVLQLEVVSLEKIPRSFAEPAGCSCKIIQMPCFYGCARSPDATERYS